MVSMFSLDNVGCRVLHVPFLDYSTPRVASREVIMVIKAPRGQVTIFKPIDELDPYYGAYIPQAEAVKAFMEQHKDHKYD